MTTTPDEPQVPSSVPPPAPPAPSGYEAASTPVAPPAYTPPPAGGYAPPPAPAYGAPAVGAPLSDADQRLWAMLSHIGAIVLGFIAPLVIWLIYKGRGQFVEEQAKESLNFQILVAIAYVIGTVTSVIGIGFIIIPVVWVAALVFEIIAGLAANKGEAYRYPLNWRLIK